uniref:Uncharacterized protein n=1 Tax=Oryza glumipatula TaxID=40148 RepID=A0A0E0BAJ6_9ORYZ
MISSVGTIRVAASIGVRLPVRWRSDWPLTSASSPYTGVGFSFVQAPSSAAPFIFSGFLWANALSSAQENIMDEAVNCSTEKQTQDKIIMGQMTCICSSSPDEGGHPRASVTLTERRYRPILTNLGFHPEKTLEVELKEGSSSNAFKKHPRREPPNVTCTPRVPAIFTPPTRRPDAKPPCPHPRTRRIWAREPDPAVPLTTNAGRRLEGRRRTQVAAAGCLRAYTTAGRRAAAGSVASTTAVAIPAANTHNTNRRTHLSRHRRPSPPPSSTLPPPPAHPQAAPRPSEREETRSAPPPPSLRPHGFAGGHSGDGEAEKVVGVGGRGAAGSPPEPPLERAVAFAL